MKRKRFLEEKIISIPGYRPARKTDRLERRPPKMIVCDNGLEFTCKATGPAQLSGTSSCCFYWIL